ncbi:MAG: hypothetical protein OES24_01700 [Acidimicrobiia bacterium]|nr:hypothetical protein [Acidimicrobiia bacterium]
MKGPGASKALGFRHAIDFVADSTKADPRVLRRLSKLGRWLVDFPVFADEFAAGVLTDWHVHELHKLDSHKVHHQLIDSQDLLVAAARDCDFSDFVNVLAYWRNAADPDGCEPAEAAAKTMCSYRKHVDGSLTGRFSFDPLTGQAFRRLLEVESQKLFRQDTGNGVTRTPTQRNGSALINLMVQGSQHGGDSSITPLINLVIGQELAEAIVRQLAEGSDVSVQPDPSDINRRCELDDGTPIHPRLAATALAVGRFRRIVFDSESRPVDVALKARLFPPWMRQVLLIRARGRCQIPGCELRLPGSRPTTSHPIRKVGRRHCRTGRSFDVCRRQTRGDLRSSRTVIPTTNGSEMRRDEVRQRTSTR